MSENQVLQRLGNLSAVHPGAVFSTQVGKVLRAQANHIIRGRRLAGLARSRARGSVS